jgi:hypothetical protein
LTFDVERPKRLVTLRRDGDDFVVLFYPEDIVVLQPLLVTMSYRELLHARR